MLCFTATSMEPRPAESAPSFTTDIGEPALFGAASSPVGDEGGDIHAFGSLVGGFLMEERMALRDAEIELLDEDATVAAAANALAALYGPDVAAGNEYPVAELNLRGSRVTTLLSTLQACPDSALAARFNKDK